MPYNIYQDDELIGTTEEKEYTVDGLSPNTDYEFSVTQVEGGKESEKASVAVKTKPIAVTGVTLAPNNMTGVSGTPSNRQLNPTVTPENATNKNVTYAVSPTTAGLTVNASGVLAWTDAVPAGTYTVTVTTTDGSKTDTSTLILSEPEIPVDTVTVSPKSVQLEVGDTQQLTAEVLPTNATNKVVNYSTDDEAIATVDNDGLVTAVAVGTATITAESYYDGSKLDTCVVEVVEPEPEPDPEEGE